MRHYSADGDILHEWRTILPGEQYSAPNDIAVDSRQRVIVADLEAMLVKVFRADGILDSTIELWPFSIALDGDNILHVGASEPMYLMKFVYVPVSVDQSSWGRIKAAFK